MLKAAVISCTLLCLSSLGTAQVSLGTCGDEDALVTCSFFFQRVNEAFRQESVLYTLRKAFFPSEGIPPFLFDVHVTLNVESVPNVACKSEEYLEEFRERPVTSPPLVEDVCLNYNCSGIPQPWSWTHQWSKTIVSYIIEREDLELLQNTNFVAHAAATFNNFDTSVFNNEDLEIEEQNATDDDANVTAASVGATRDEAVEFQLTIPYLPCIPDEGVMLDAWEDILPWLQLYAQNSDNLELQEVEYTQKARGFAFREGRARSGGLTVPLLAVIHILINIVFALATTYFLHKYHGHLNQVKGKQYQLVASMYWSVVIMCLIGAIIIIVGNGWLYYALIFIEDQSLSVFGFRIASDITVAILAVVELLASMLTPHDPKFFIPHLIRRTLCLNQCCHCCGSDTRLNFLRRAILGVAMWIIIVFLQLVIASLLPLAVVVFVNPVPSLAFISIMIALFFCLVIFIAYFLNAFEGNYIARHRLSVDQRRNSSLTWEMVKADWNVAGNWAREKLILVAQAFVFLVIFIIVAMIIILYLNFVRAGANTNTVGGLLISLVPSVVLGGITWAAKKHLFKELEEEIEAEKEEEEGETEEAEDNPVFQIGGFSFQPGRRRSTKRKKNTVKENGHASGTSNLINEEASIDGGNDIKRNSTAIEIYLAQDGDAETKDYKKGSDLETDEKKEGKGFSDEKKEEKDLNGGEEKGASGSGEMEVQEKVWKEELAKSVSIDMPEFTLRNLDVDNTSTV